MSQGKMELENHGDVRTRVYHGRHQNGQTISRQVFQGWQVAKTYLELGEKNKVVQTLFKSEQREKSFFCDRLCFSRLLPRIGQQMNIIQKIMSFVCKEM